MHTHFYKKLALIFIFAVGINLSAALPGNISILVDKSAPAVVNITAKKDVSQGQSYSLRGLPIPDEMLERFGIPREFRDIPQQKREAVSYGSGFILKDNYIMTNFDFSRMNVSIDSSNKISSAINSKEAKIIAERSEEQLTDYVMKIVNEPGFMAGNEIVDLRNVGYQYNPSNGSNYFKDKENFQLRIEKRNFGLNNCLLYTSPSPRDH